MMLEIRDVGILGFPDLIITRLEDGITGRA